MQKGGEYQTFAAGTITPQICEASQKTRPLLKAYAMGSTMKMPKIQSQTARLRNGNEQLEALGKLATARISPRCAPREPVPGPLPIFLIPP